MYEKICVPVVGKAGTGKTVLGKSLAKALELPHISVGDDIFASIATRHGISRQALEVLALEDASVDREIDGRILRLYKESEGLVIDSRRAADLIPSAFSILLFCPDDGERFRRIAERKKISIEQATKETTEREDAFCQRFNICPCDFLNPQAFCHRNGLVLNSQFFDERTIFRKAFAAVRLHYGLVRCRV